MSSYPSNTGKVTIGKYDLSAKCRVCKKSIVYAADLKLAAWKETLRQFVKQHRECKGVDQ